YVDHSTLHATGGNVELTTSETGTIDALTIGGAVAVGGGGANGVGVGLAGAGSGNTVKNSVLSYIQNNSSVTITTSGSLNVSATDISHITANAGGIGIAV